MTIKEFYERNPEERQFGELNLPGKKKEPALNPIKKFIIKIIHTFSRIKFF